MSHIGFRTNLKKQKLNWTHRISAGKSFHNIVAIHSVVEPAPPVAVIASIIEPGHEISNYVVCATSKASDQPAHTRSLIRAFACRLSIL